MKKTYEKMEIIIEELNKDDVITASGYEPSSAEEHENAYVGFWDF